jgi:hypothetical protein
VDVARASASIDELIDRRIRARSVADELELMYKDSARRNRQKLREENRWEWIRHYEQMASNHHGLAEDYQRRALDLLEGSGGGGGSLVEWPVHSY